MANKKELKEKDLDNVNGGKTIAFVVDPYYMMLCENGHYWHSREEYEIGATVEVRCGNKNCKSRFSTCISFYEGQAVGVNIPD